MKKSNKKIKEPYEPEDTPTPPQIIEPDTARKREIPVEGKGKNGPAPDNKINESGQKQHLLADDADIDDETTV